LPDTSRRVRAAIVVALATVLLIGLFPAVSEARTPPGIDRFLWALGQVESGGRYTARNATTGAYGKYQILPTTWPGWARRYLGNARARQTPRNQEIVARGQVSVVWSAVRDWRVVAHSWLTGRAERDPSTWSAAARRYIGKVMTYYRRAPANLGPALGIGDSAAADVSLVDDSSRSITYGGSWRTARHGSYVGDSAHYATAAGATATFTFVGRKVTWYGPIGPTRGQARVFVDGKLARTVDLHATGFRARTVAFSTRWSSSGAHTLRIEVVGTRGHSLVALDAISVVR
jgi:hypothetical protein